MKAFVYHAKTPDFKAQVRSLNLMQLDQGYDCVAILISKVGEEEEEGQLLERAFEKTNHIDSTWFDAPDDEHFKVWKRDVRSTSVGDIVVLEHDDGKEEFKICAPFGWENVRFDRAF